MSDQKNIISMVLGVFPQVTEAGNKYKITEPDRESRGLSRGIANEKTLFEQTVQKLLLFAHTSSIHDDGWIQRLGAELGATTAERILHDLQTISEQLETLKAELLNAGRGKVKIPIHL
jgi:hypothetical protein